MRFPTFIYLQPKDHETWLAKRNIPSDHRPKWIKTIVAKRLEETLNTIQSEAVALAAQPKKIGRPKATE